jgi:hypothetical protein
MKHRFIDITKVEFLDVQKADFEFSGLLVYLKHHLSDFNQVAISTLRMQKMSTYAL